MRFLDCSAKRTYLGLAHGPGVLEFLSGRRDIVDYLEVPFEQLRHTPELGALQESVPVILHCASLSIAGFVPPSEATVEAIQREADRTQTPWIGEHLAFVSADGIHEEPDRDTAPTNLTFTLCPQLSEETIDRVAENLNALRARFPVPLILENSPQYYPMPGSTMSLTEFVARVAERCDTDMLLDLSHLMITSANTGTDAAAELDRLPLERVVEIHMSGMSVQSGITWDDHAVPAPEEQFQLLERTLGRAKPRALTIEYNWSALPEPVLLSHVAKTRRLLDRQ
jgi:uncharacterized protein